MKNLCRIWLLLVAALFVCFGLFMAFFNQTPIFNFAFNTQVNPVFWGGQTVPPESIHFQMWIYGVLGATCAGWGMMIAFLVIYAFPLGKTWVWWCLAASISFWVLVDTAISWNMKVYFNVLFNLVVFGSAAIPLLITRKDFLKAK